MTPDKQNPADQLEVMRIALIVQIHELIDVAMRQAHRMHKLGDTEERDYINGAIDHALKVIAQFNYNGLLQAPPESVAAVPDEQAVFEEWMARVCPSGDVTEVHEQWLASSEYEDWLDGQLPTLVYYWRTKALAYKDRVLEAFENGRKSVLARDPLDVADEQIIHLWDTHVGEPTPSRPFTNADKVNFAHAILYAAHNIKAVE